MVAILLVSANYYCKNMSTNMPANRVKQIEQFLKSTVAETLEADYKRHNMTLTVVVTGLEIDKIHKTETDTFISYVATGKVSYVIKGKREWKDEQGNIIRLDPEQEITHWFSCGVLEDRYGSLLKDRRNRLSFYAEATHSQ